MFEFLKQVSLLIGVIFVISMLSDPHGTLDYTNDLIHHVIAVIKSFDITK